MQDNHTPNLSDKQLESRKAFCVIPLNQGQFTLIDTVDLDLLKFNWTAQFSSSIDGYYAFRGEGGRKNRKRIQMHRCILERMLGIELKRSDRVDHVNHNTLDNRRENLRLATVAQNAHNSKIAKNNTSGYKGVSWHSAGRKWCAQIKNKKVKIHLGVFDDKDDAARAYNTAALELFGEFALLNVIPDDYKQVESLAVAHG